MPTPNPVAYELLILFVIALQFIKISKIQHEKCIVHEFIELNESILTFRYHFNKSSFLI